MAVVILGGLVVSTIINLFAIPALYLRFASAQPQLEMPRTNGSEQHA
jgi:Cu/Ag efflux pump CusA